MIVNTYVVHGMTCGHCAAAVTGEVGKIAGVTGVEVDVSAGRVTVTSDGPLPGPDIEEAVEEAGYQLVADQPSQIPPGGR
ncbi:heavy-metal-associated domain-containing protein [Solwaraspora sp. WMMB335]|uniref:heavy-metal-associated domain-containing protein n=1 Tax=Solwaraspora sp. WMMB335 TaxID=3404118 RepID=UPI003B945060